MGKPVPQVGARRSEGWPRIAAVPALLAIGISACSCSKGPEIGPTVAGPHHVGARVSPTGGAGPTLPGSNVPIPNRGG